VPSLLRDFKTISIHDGDPMHNFNQFFTSILGKIPLASQPSKNNLCHYYMIEMNTNTKYMLNDKSITTLDVAKETALEIEKNMEESNMDSSSVGQPYFNMRPKNKIICSEGPRYESSPTQTTRMEDKESFETLKLLIKMNNKILSLNPQVNELWFYVLTRSRPPTHPRIPPRILLSKVDWCHFFQNCHDTRVLLLIYMSLGIIQGRKYTFTSN
jgi:hypothetical protein